jgi:hypothetical protein
MERAIRRHNPIAKDLRTPKYRQRIVPDPNLYDRKVKHKNTDVQNLRDPKTSDSE